MRSPHITRKQGASAFVFSALGGEKARLLDFEPATVMILLTCQAFLGAQTIAFPKRNALHRQL